MPTIQINHYKKSFELKPEIKSNPRKLDLGHDLYHTLIDLSDHIPPPSGCPTTQNIILRNHSKILRRGFELKPEIKSNPRKLDLGHDLAAKDRAKTKTKRVDTHFCFLIQRALQLVSGMLCSIYSPLECF